MIDKEYFVNYNKSSNESSFVVSSSRCFFLDPLNEYEPGGLLYVESVITTVINLVGAIIAIWGNGIILLTFWKTSQLRSQSHLFLWCLAFADFLTGLIGQPFYGAYKIALLSGHASSSSCVCRVIFETVAWFSAALSCALVSSIVGDRYLALHFHLRYHVVVTTKKVAFHIMYLVITMAILSLSRFATTTVTPFLYVNILGLLSGFFTLLMCYWKIFKQVLRHFRKIQDQAFTESQTIDMQRFKKSVINMAYVAFLYMISYMPFTCVLFVYLSCGFTRNVEVAYDITRTLAFMNSSWNPFIYFWRVEELREAVRKTLRWAHWLNTPRMWTFRLNVNIYYTCTHGLNILTWCFNW